MGIGQRLAAFARLSSRFFRLRHHTPNSPRTRETDYPLSATEHHHWNTVCVGVMTIGTVILVGMFGLFGLVERDPETLTEAIPSTTNVSPTGPADILCKPEPSSDVNEELEQPSLREVVNQTVTLLAITTVPIYALCLMACCTTILMPPGTTRRVKAAGVRNGILAFQMVAWLVGIIAATTFAFLR